MAKGVQTKATPGAGQIIQKGTDTTMNPAELYYQIYKHIDGAAMRPIFVEEVRDVLRATHRVDLLNLRLSPQEEVEGWSYFRSDGTQQRTVRSRRAPARAAVAALRRVAALGA